MESYRAVWYSFDLIEAWVSEKSVKFKFDLVKNFDWFCLIRFDNLLFDRYPLVICIRNFDKLLTFEKALCCGLRVLDLREVRRSTESRQFKTLLEKDWRSHYIDVKRRHRIDFRQMTSCRLSSKMREGKAESRPSKLELTNLTRRYKSS